MIVHKCDRCGKETDSWFKVKIEIGASKDYSTGRRMIDYKNGLSLDGLSSYDLCLDCFENMFCEDKEEINLCDTCHKKDCGDRIPNNSGTCMTDCSDYISNPCYSCAHFISCWSPLLFEKNITFNCPDYKCKEKG